MSTDSLFTPVTLGDLHLANRVIMSSLTRCRADAEHIPTPIMAEYYAQRASAGLVMAEATMAMEGNSSFQGREPGIYSAAQIAGWKVVTDAVHAKGGLIMLQIWHGGRACHSLLNNGRQPVAPSALRIENDEIYTPEGKKPYEIPRALRDDEIPDIIAGFVHAAKCAQDAGFDGVEVHGANGYLLDQFLRSGSNQRTGPYGGPLENRAKLLLEVTDAVIGVWGASRVAVRISPLNSYNFMKDADPVGLTTYVASQLSQRKIAFLDLMRADFMGQQKADVITPARKHFSGALVGNMGYTAAEGAAAIDAGTLQAVSYGHHYVSNPDLVERFKRGLTPVEPNPNTLYSSGPVGYTDYPALVG